MQTIRYIVQQDKTLQKTILSNLVQYFTCKNSKKHLVTIDQTCYSQARNYKTDDVT